MYILAGMVSVVRMLKCDGCDVIAQMFTASGKYVVLSNAGSSAAEKRIAV